MSHFYLPRPWPDAGSSLSDEVVIDSKVAHHLRVRRLAVGETFKVFDGQGLTANATLIALDKKQAVVRLGDIQHFVRTETKSPILLAQGIAGGDKMDWLIEKCVELGVAQIQPLQSERSVVRLDGERSLKKREHWQNIAIAACEQSGRTVIPEVSTTLNLPVWLASIDPKAEMLKLMLSPRAEIGLMSVAKRSTPQKTLLLIGPEGGLSETEEEQATRAGFIPVSMGQRVLRTETAGIVALSVLHTVWNQL